jgi:hypothetical protein
VYSNIRRKTKEKEMFKVDCARCEIVTCIFVALLAFAGCGEPDTSLPLGHVTRLATSVYNEPGHLTWPFMLRALNSTLGNPCLRSDGNGNDVLQDTCPTVPTGLDFDDQEEVWQFFEDNPEFIWEAIVNERIDVGPDYRYVYIIRLYGTNQCLRQEDATPQPNMDLEDCPATLPPDATVTDVEFLFVDNGDILTESGYGSVYNDGDPIQPITGSKWKAVTGSDPMESHYLIGADPGFQCVWGTHTCKPNP